MNIPITSTSLTSAPPCADSPLFGGPAWHRHEALIPFEPHVPAILIPAISVERIRDSINAAVGSDPNSKNSIPRLASTQSASSGLVCNFVSPRSSRVAPVTPEVYPSDSIKWSGHFSEKSSGQPLGNYLDYRLKIVRLSLSIFAIISVHLCLHRLQLWAQLVIL